MKIVMNPFSEFLIGTKPVLIVFIIICYTHDANIYSQYENIHFEHITSKDGLPDNTLNTIYQDSKGFIWIGTTNGLARFDGYGFLNFNYLEEDTTSLSGIDVRHILEDKYCNLWITTNNGLNKFDRKSQTFKRFNCYNSKSGQNCANSFFNICIDRKENFWISSHSDGLLLFFPDKGLFKRFLHNPDVPGSISSNYVRSAFEDSEGRLWLLTDAGGIDRFNYNDSSFSFYPILGLTKEKDVLRMLETKEGKLLIHSSINSSGYFIFDPNNQRIIQKCDANVRNCGLSVNRINNCIIDSQGNYWFATDGDGVNLKLNNSNEWLYLKKSQHSSGSLSSDIVRFVYEDKVGSIWLGTQMAGINVWHKNRQKFKLIRHNPNDPGSLPYDAVASVFVEKNNSALVGLDGGGLAIVDLKTFKTTRTYKPYDKPSIIYGSKILSIIADDEDNLYFGYWADGISQYNKKTRKSIHFLHDPSNKNSLPSNLVWELFIDSKKRIWIATQGGGVGIFDKKTKTFITYKHNPSDSSSLSDDFVYSIYEDSKNNIWIGTSGYGLNLFNESNNTFTRYYSDNRNPDAISYNSIFSIIEDSKKRLWIGTKMGLNHFDPQKGKFEKYYVKNGLPGNSIHSILEDNHGNLWMSTDNGLSRFNPETRLFRNYSESDGLQGMEFSVTRATKDSSGNMYFFGPNGLNIFNPDKICDNLLVPNIAFTSIRIYNEEIRVGQSVNGKVILSKAIDETDTLIISYKENVFSIEFSALDFLEPQKNKYAYLLEGFENKWIQTEHSRRYASFTNLNPGTYVLRVKASNNDGIWNENGISLVIIITPPWWKTLWFRVSISFLISLMIVFIYRARITILERQKRILEEKVNLRTHELQALNIELTVQKEEILLQQASILEQNEQLRQQKEETELISQKLHDADQSKIRFFMNVSHEFRTPLTLILGPLENLINNVKEFELKTQLALIYRNTNRLLRLVNQLLDLRKLETGSMKLVVSESNLVEHIKNIFHSFDYMATRQNISYIFEPNTHHYITWFDPDVVEKIMYNLISNAFKFTPDGRDIIVSFTSDYSKKFWELKVKDSGMGIKKEIIPYIFDRFFTDDKNKIRKQSGTGIGLALTKDLVELHYGKMEVFSEVGIGSEFRIYLPKDKTVFKPEEIGQKHEYDFDSNEKYPHVTKWSDDLLDVNDETNKQEIDKDKPLLLLVDDNSDILLFLNHQLNSDYHIISAPNGKKGLELALTYLPDLIISDVMMTEMDGMELCNNIKSDIRICHTPIILLTAKNSEESELQGLETGADCYMRKPFSTPILKANIKTLLENRQKVREKFYSRFERKEFIEANSNLDKKFMERIIKYVEESIETEEIDIQRFATAMGMGRTTFYNKIKALTGCTVNEFVIKMKLEISSKILATTDLNVSEVAFKVGFKNLSHFTKIFKDTYKMTPKEFQRKNKSVMDE